MKKKIEDVLEIYKIIYELLIKFSSEKINKLNIEKIWMNLEDSELNVLLSYIHINVFNLMEFNMSNSLWYLNLNEKEEINSRFLKNQFKFVNNKIISSEDIEKIIKNENIDKNDEKILFLFLYKDRIFDQDALKIMLQNIITWRVDFAHKYYKRYTIKKMLTINKNISSIMDILSVYLCFSYLIEELE